MTGRVRIRALKAVAIACAVGGVAALWVLATRSQTPVVPISQLGAAMNMAYVRIAGTCVDTPSYDAESGYLSFWIDDGTGELYVSSYQEQTEQIMAQDRLPALGDRVEVAGTIRVREDVPSLVVNVPEHLAVLRPDPVTRAVSEIGVADVYSRVRIRGQVREVREPYPGLTIVTIHDGTGAIPVVLSSVLMTPGEGWPAVTLGQVVELVAAVSVFRGAPQLVPATGDDIVPVATSLEIDAVRPIGELSAGDEGHLVAIRGAVTQRDDFSAGVKLVLDDGTGDTVVLLWQSLYDALTDTQATGLGATLEVLGEVALYLGQLEVVPQIPQDVRILERAAERPPTPGTPAASALAPALNETASPHARPAATLTSPSTSEPPPGEAQRVGLTATATSVPNPTATRTLTRTPPPVSELTSIGALAADRVGDWVTVEGEVLAASSFSAGFKFILQDGTGQVVLLLWHDVYDSCWDAAEINLGARLRASGEIAVYEDELQIQPGFGSDVKAITSAAPWAPPRLIGSLTGDDVGRRVMIEGRVIRVEGISGAVKVFVGDDTGEVVVFIWRNVLDRIAANTGLGTPGSRVRVVGTVNLYRSNLEVIPALPVDVIVLSAP